MPPKKAEVVAEKPILGRFASHLKIGICGMPNVGKSTMFNVLTKCSIPAENFPFCTIDPNTSRVTVPDERFDWLCNQYKPKSKVPAFLEVVDIAGLVKGASSGEGLGNAFLSHIRAVDGIFHVMRAFDDPDVIHVEDRVDPIDDIEIITNELRLKDIDFVEKNVAELKKMIPRGLKKEQKEELASAEKVLAWLVQGKDIRNGMDEWNLKDVDYLNERQFLTAKPVVFLVNLSPEDYARKKNKWLLKIADWVTAHGGGKIIPFSGKLEADLVDMPDDERARCLEEKKLDSALPKIIKTGFAAIQLIYFFTAGEDEVKCWTLRRGMKAPQAAGTIHTDFEKGFICAEVMAFEELREAGSESAVKAKGRYRQEGKGYVMQDGDVTLFKFGRT